MQKLEGHRSETNLSEFLFYLEEMYDMELLTEEEMTAYERYKWSGKMSKKHYKMIKNNINHYFFEKF